MEAALQSVTAQVEARIVPFLGGRTAASAVALAARTWVGREGGALTTADLPRLCQGLAPMLRTFLGAEVTQQLLDRILREVRG